MAKVLVTDTHLTNIANAIRSKKNSSATYKPSEMADAISSIETGSGGSSGGSNVTKGFVVNSWDSEGFPTDVTIVGMTSIPNYYFYYSSYYYSPDKSWLGSIGANLHLPDNLTTIGDFSFYYCTNLALTSLPDTVTTIGTYAFNYCTNLRLTSLPSSLTSLDAYTFYGCSSLALTSLPSSLTSIGRYAFNGCKGLTTLDIPANCTITGNGTAYGAFRNCTNLTTVTLGASGVPYTQTNAGQYSFYGCSKIEKIVMYTSDGTGTANYFYKTSTSTYHTIEFRQA